MVIECQIDRASPSTDFSCAYDCFLPLFNIIQPSEATSADKISLDYKKLQRPSSEISHPCIFCRLWIPSSLACILVYRPAPRTAYFLLSSTIQYKLSSRHVIPNISCFLTTLKNLPDNPRVLRPQIHVCQAFMRYCKQFSPILRKLAVFTNIQNVNGCVAFMN
jgi:hypothetical protein